MTDRRSFLTAALIAPVAIAAPAMAAPISTWDNLMSAYLRAKAQSDAADAQHERLYAIGVDKFGQNMPLKRSPEELAWRESSGINEAAHRCDALANVTSDLHAKLVRTPAPHAAALLFKLEWALDGEGEPFVDVSTVIVEDAKRLLAAMSWEARK